VVRLLNIVGLILNIIGALLLLRFPPGMAETFADGGTKMVFAGHIDPGSYVAVLTLVVGFALQLIAAMRTK
jgi:hypothetical protein